MSMHVMTYTALGVLGIFRWGQTTEKAIYYNIREKRSDEVLTFQKV